jgi:hypothetical protein
MSSVNINDRFHVNDNVGGLRGEVLIGRNRIIEEYINPYGQKAYRSKLGEVLFREKNIVPIGGYQYVFNKLFNIALDTETTLRVGDLNDDAPLSKIGTDPGMMKYLYDKVQEFVPGENPGDIDRVPGVDGVVNIPATHFVQGFMIGDGGALEDNISARSTDYKRRTLFHAVPFRMSTDGFARVGIPYWGRFVDMNKVTSYYIKGFSAPAPHIVHSWVSDIADQFEVVDETVFVSTSTYSIESYIEIAITIDEYDSRGYFSTVNATPRINELGLVAGWLNPHAGREIATQDEYADLDAIRLFTHFTRPSIILEQGDTIDALYRIYAR